MGIINFDKYPGYLKNFIRMDALSYNQGDTRLYEAYVEDLLKIKHKDIMIDFCDLNTYVEYVYDYIVNSFANDDLFEELQALDYDTKFYILGDSLTFNKQEIVTNKIGSGPLKGAKLTKYLHRLANFMKTKPPYITKWIDGMYKYSEGRPTSNIVITADPNQILDIYNEILSCFSEEGGNALGLLQLIASKFVYVAYPTDRTSRILVLRDDERKTIAMLGIYGRYDQMFALSVSEYFRKLDYSFCSSVGSAFYDDCVKYLDSPTIYNIERNVQLFRSNTFKEIRQILESTGFNNKLDIFTYTLTDWNLLCGDDCLKKFCVYCSTYVHADDYNFDDECCFDCAPQGYVCDHCGGSFVVEEMYFIEHYYYDSEQDEIFVIDNVCPSCHTIGYQYLADFFENFIDVMSEQCLSNFKNTYSHMSEEIETAIQIARERHKI